MTSEKDDFSIDDLDELIHSKLRLGIMAYLSTAKSASFSMLKERLKASDGNLSIQITKLEEAGYVEVQKMFVGKKPLTQIILTEAGHKAYLGYIDTLRRLL